QPDAALPDLDRVQVQEHVRHHRELSVAAVARHPVAEDRAPDLGVGDVVPGPGQERLGRLGGHVKGSLYALRNASALPHSPVSCWTLTALSTRICPSSASTMRARSSGRGAGPSKFTPLM